MIATLDIVALEAVSARAWPAMRAERLGGWRLHASTGFTGRANTCWALGDPAGPVEQALDRVERWYAQLGLPPGFKTVDGAGAPADLPDRLRARGYAPHSETQVMTGPLSSKATDGVEIGQTPDAAFQSVLFAALYRDEGDARERLETLRRIPAPVFFARLDVDGEPAAVGACAVDGTWAGLSVMRTVEAYRRRGLAAQVMDALLTRAGQAGASRAYLQVEADNTGAVSLYRRHGFTPAYAYRYWRRAA